MDLLVTSEMAASLGDVFLAHRQELVSGKGTPTADELADCSEADDSTTAAVAGHKGVPYFWLNALYNQVCGSQHGLVQFGFFFLCFLPAMLWTMSTEQQRG